jgi:hypothetical protein
MVRAGGSNMSKLDEARALFESTADGLSVTAEDDTVTIVVSRMYEYVECGYAELSKLAALFGTDKIDLGRDSWSGCDTCDWGSKYEITITISGAVL